MNYKDSTHMYHSQRYIELMLVILIIGILTAFAMSFFQDLKKTAWTFHIFGAEYIINKNKSILYFAHNGEWPKNIPDAENFAKSVGWATREYERSSNEPIKQVNIENGAINFNLENKDLGLNKTISLRPATPANDIFGPVIWVCGEKRNPAKWKIFGKDKTNVNDKYINRFIK